MGRNRRRFVVAAFVGLVLAWGSSFAFVKVGLESSPPLIFAGVRSLLGGVVMVGAALRWGGKLDLGRNWRPVVLLALFNVALFIGFQTFAVLELPSGSAAILVYLQPILVGFLAWAMLGEPISAVKVLGLLFGFAGIVVVSAGGVVGAGALPPLGIAFGVASAVAWAVGTVYFKRVQERISPLWSVGAPFTVGGCVLALTGFATEPLSEVSVGPSLVVSLLYSALIGISASWLIWLTLVGMGEASRVSAYIFVVPLIAVAIGVVFLGEPLHATLLAGAALVVFGIYLVNRSPERSEETAPGGP